MSVCVCVCVRRCVCYSDNNFLCAIGLRLHFMYLKPSKKQNNICRKTFISDISVYLPRENVKNVRIWHPLSLKFASTEHIFILILISLFIFYTLQPF